MRIPSIKQKSIDELGQNEPLLPSADGISDSVVPMYRHGTGDYVEPLYIAIVLNRSPLTVRLTIRCFGDKTRRFPHIL